MPEILNQVLARLEKYIAENDLFQKSDRILVAVSGGIDSVVLLNLLFRLGYYCSIAHCNFKLRSSESDRDEEFVHELASAMGIAIYTKSFDTAEYSGSNRLSTQMAARELRYDWFEEVRIEKGYDWIATAHNLNDVTETFLLNLSRGTGIKGLTGIRCKNGRLVRPLLFATRESIIEFARQSGIQWREDSSNSSLKYSRNKIRNLIIPAFEEINPNFSLTLADNIRKIKEAEEIFTTAVNEKRKQYVIRETGHFRISISDLLSLSPLETWLFEFLKDFNFTPGIVSDIARSLHGASGKQFLSSTHRLVKDRDVLLIHPLKPVHPRKFYIEDPYREISEPLPLEMDVITNHQGFNITASPSLAFLDLDVLEFPLIIRKWEPGDYFRPLGMSQMKKISDFFIDQKISLPEKENTWILQSGKEIAWVIGLRIADPFKVSEKTGKILRIKKL